MSNPAYENPPGIGALFDLSFTRFITVSFIRVIYILGMVMLGIAWLGIVFTGFGQGGIMGGLAAIFVGTILIAIYLLFLRVWLELIVVIFRIGENTSAMARASGVSAPTGGFPVMPAASQPPM